MGDQTYGVDFIFKERRETTGEREATKKSRFPVILRLLETLNLFSMNENTNRTREYSINKSPVALLTIIEQMQIIIEFESTRDSLIFTSFETFIPRR